VDYLAFYQTGAFGEEKWRIQYVAPVRGFELTTRGELLKDEIDHPHARHEYYKVQIGSLVRLPEAVLAGKWRRITFLYTTGEYLSNARTINDLVVHNEERETLWKTLRERGLAGQYAEKDELMDFDIDPVVLAGLLGISQNNFLGKKMTDKT